MEGPVIGQPYPSLPDLDLSAVPVARPPKRTVPPPQTAAEAMDVISSALSRRTGSTRRLKDGKVPVSGKRKDSKPGDAKKGMLDFFKAGPAQRPPAPPPPETNVTLPDGGTWEPGTTMLPVTKAPRIVVVEREHRTGRKEVSYEYAQSLLSNQWKKVREWAMLCEGPIDVIQAIMMRVLKLFVDEITLGCDSTLLPASTKQSITIDLVSIGIEVMDKNGRDGLGFYSVDSIAAGMLDDNITPHFRFLTTNLGTNWRGLAYTDLAEIRQARTTGSAARGYTYTAFLNVPSSSVATLPRMALADHSSVSEILPFTLVGEMLSTAFSDKTPVKLEFSVTAPGSSWSGHHIVAFDFDPTHTANGQPLWTMLAFCTKCFAAGDTISLPFYIETGPLEYGRMILHMWRGSAFGVGMGISSFRESSSSFQGSNSVSIVDIGRCLEWLNRGLKYLLLSMASQSEGSVHRDTVRIQVQKGLGSQFCFSVIEKVYSLCILSLNILIPTMDPESVNAAGNNNSVSAERLLGIMKVSRPWAGIFFFLTDYIVTHNSLNTVFDSAKDLGLGDSLSGFQFFTQGLVLMLTLIETYDTMVGGLRGSEDDEAYDISNMLIRMMIHEVPIESRERHLMRFITGIGNARLQTISSYEEGQMTFEIATFCSSFSDALARHSPQ